MIGDFVARTLALVLGYAYPAYECFKTVELNKPDISQLIFWCQYWILVAVLTVFERVGDNLVSWIPMYSEAKLAFFIYLWCPKMKGTTYVYETFFRPYVSKHENEIDRNLLELRTRAGDFAILYFQKAASYGQTRLFQILQYVASQSPSQSQSSRPRTAQRQPPPPQVQGQPPSPQVQRQPPSPHVQRQSPPQQVRRATSLPNANQQTVNQHQQLTASTPSSPSKSQPQEPTKGVLAPPRAAVPQSPTSSGLSGQASSESSSSQPPSKGGDAVQVGAENSLNKEDPGPPLQETPIEEAIRITRGRLRKRVAPAGASVSTRK